MNARDSKWDTQKLKWSNISLTLTFLNQTSLSQQSKCTIWMEKKKNLWPVILLQNLQGRVLCVWKGRVNNTDCPFPPLPFVALEPFNQQLASISNYYVTGGRALIAVAAP
jgi:hypothetical protein